MYVLMNRESAFVPDAPVLPHVVINCSNARIWSVKLSVRRKQRSGCVLSYYDCDAVSLRYLCFEDAGRVCPFGIVRDDYWLSAPSRAKPIFGYTIRRWFYL